MDFSRFDALSFDCYGTLVDWESGILASLRPVLDAHGVDLADDRLLELYASLESDVQRGAFRPYADVLRSVAEGICRSVGFRPDPDERECLVASIGEWPPFPDTREALESLGARFRLAVLSNVDDELFARTARALGVDFDVVVTAQQVGSYKPSHQNFEALLKALELPRERVLHVAQSLYHDIEPAKALGFTAVWVNRRGGRAGPGATRAPLAHARPDLEVPDLGTLAERVAGPLPGPGGPG